MSHDAAEGLAGPSKADATVNHWFGSLDDEADAVEHKPLHGAGPSRHGQHVAPATIAAASTSLTPVQSVAHDHRKMAALPSSKKFASYIDRWNSQRDAEEEAQTSKGGAAESVGAVESKDDAHFDYTDEVKKVCLLCQRQFKAVEVLRRHCLESDLHKKNLEDDKVCEAGRGRKDAALKAQKAPLPTNMKRAGFAPVAKDQKEKDEENSEQYRDRAQERRAVFGVEKQPRAWSGPKVMQPVRLKSISGNGAAQKEEKTDPTPSAPAVLDEASVGGSLLAKMGWTSGQGLGAGGSGRVAPVEASVYAQGAGLGSGRARPASEVEDERQAADTSKRARVQDGSYGEYLRDRTRIRFSKSSDETGRLT